MTRVRFRKRDERGSAAVEAAIGVPAFMLFIGLIIFAGRTAVAHQAVESAAADAARSASIARTSSAASGEAKQAARTSLANQQLACVDVQVNVDTGAFTKPVGQAATVEVTVECRLDLSDLSVPGVPGSRVVRGSMTSPLDSWRERSSGFTNSEGPIGANSRVVRRW
jgi:Flp pilus assembly protein TadG